MNQRSSRAVVLELLVDGFGRGDRSVFERIVAADYIQHSPYLPGGRAGLFHLLDELAKIPDNVFRPVRVLEDDDLVLVHSAWIAGGIARAVVDLFRVEDGLLVEHWDAMQEQPARTASGRSMLDGPAAPRPREAMIAKALVGEFLQTVMVRGRLDRLHAFFDGDRLLQHSPNVPDGVSGLRGWIQELADKGADLHYHRVHRIGGEGDLVFAQSEGTLGGEPTAFYDLFRVEDGRIAEHWDVIQPVPATSLNDNGMF